MGVDGEHGADMAAEAAMSFDFELFDLLRVRCRRRALAAALRYAAGFDCCDMNVTRG